MALTSVSALALNFEVHTREQEILFQGYQTWFLHPKSQLRLGLAGQKHLANCYVYGSVGFLRVGFAEIQLAEKLSLPVHHLNSFGEFYSSIWTGNRLTATHRHLPNREAPSHFST
jgi:hypothetical protein